MIVAVTSLIVILHLWHQTVLAAEDSQGFLVQMMRVVLKVTVSFALSFLVNALVFRIEFCSKSWKIYFVIIEKKSLKIQLESEYPIPKYFECRVECRVECHSTTGPVLSSNISKFIQHTEQRSARLSSIPEYQKSIKNIRYNYCIHSTRLLHYYLVSLILYHFFSYNISDYSLSTHHR